MSVCVASVPPSRCRLLSAARGASPLGSDNPAPGQRPPSPPPPTISDYLCRTLTPFNFLKAAHVNTQSLLCHIDEFRNIFDTALLDIILVSETWLKPYINDTSVSLTGYNVFRNDRLHKGGGGVAIYVKSHLPTSVLFSSDTSRQAHPEFMFLDVNVHGIHVLVCVCYRAPGLGHMDEFEHVLLDTLVRYSHVIVMGDFNADLLGPLSCYDSTFLTIMLQLLNLSLLPLQHHISTSGTWLDILAVNDMDLVAHHRQVPAPGLFKHDLLFCVYKLRPQKPKAKFIQYRDLKSVDHDSILSNAMTLSWQGIILLPDVDFMVGQFNFLFNSLLDAPLITYRVTKNPFPWFTDHIRLLQKQCDISFRKAKQSVQSGLVSL